MGDMVVKDVEQTYQIADQHRRVHVVFGMTILIAFLVPAVLIFAFVPLAGGGAAMPGEAALVAMNVITGLARLVLGIYLMVCCYRLSRSLGGSGAGVILLLLPLLNLVYLLILINKGKAYLRERDIPMGFLGPSPEDVESLRRKAGV